MKRVLTALVVLVMLGLFGGTLWYLWHKSQKPSVIFKTETAAVSDIVKKTVATGSVIPRKEVAVKPQVSGIIPGDKGGTTLIANHRSAALAPPVSLV